MKRQAKKTGGEPVAPPLIEHDPPPKLAGHVQSGVAQARRLGDALNRLARRTAYWLSLVGLIGLTLGFLTLALLQVGNIKTPDWRALLDGGRELLSSWQASRPGRLRETPPSEAEFGPKLDTRPETKSPETLNPETQSEGTAATTSDQLGERANIPANAQESAPANVQESVSDAEQLARLTARAALADLLLRLHSGWPFDDLLDSGTLDQLLRSDEMALLALYAHRGLPTWADLRAQAETLPRIASATSTGSAEPAIPAALAWLADKAPGLVNLRPAPLAGAQSHYRDLHQHITQRDLAAAGQTLRRLMVMSDAAMLEAAAKSKGNDNSNGAALGDALHALYADVQAVGETDTLLRTLRADYLSGARP